MKNLNMISRDDITVAYKLAEIKKITYSLASDVLSSEEIIGNGIKPCEMLMIISFKDGSESTFSIHNNKWSIIFD